MLWVHVGCDYCLELVGMDDEVVMGVDNVPADVGVFGDEPVLRIHCHIVLPVLE